VHTLGFGSGRTGAGLGRIADVFGGVADIQGLEPGSSPTSGTHDPSSEGFLLYCVNIVPRRVSLTRSGVCAWRRGRLFGCVGCGSVSWLVDLPLAGIWGYVSGFLAVSGGQVSAVTDSWPEVVVTT